MEENNRNFLLAMALSIMVLFSWQAFFTQPEAERQRQQQAANQPSAQTTTPPVGQQGIPATPGTHPMGLSREAALAASKRIPIETPSLQGSINLTGARIDDLTLREFRESVKPNSKNVVLFSPSGSPDPFYAEHGWMPGAAKVPTRETVWNVEQPGDALSPGKPLTLTYDNGEGLLFRRTLTVDDKFMFTIVEEVENKTNQPVTLRPFGLISRHGKPKVEGLFMLHEGPYGVMGDDALEYETYDEVVKKRFTYENKSGWMGITDKYWAASVIPDQNAHYEAHFSADASGSRPTFQADYLLDNVTIKPNEKHSVSSMVFAGAKQVNLIDAYEDKYKIYLFDKMIDWGWFPFITKPLFHALDFFYKLVGNFGLSILIVTVLVKLAFFPLANKSYESMSKMKKLQPEMKRLQERYKDDRMKQQQELMALYKKEKINPMSGCLPILIQIPVFFALYKVLYVSIEMRHAPFFGWIQDLSAPDPTTIFNLFGLIPWDPPALLMLGVWPIIMGITMFLQMKLNPAPPDPVQAQIFTWMPVMFTFLLASFPAGLVIYWSWNNILSMLQQWTIMKRQGVEVNLLENIGITRKGAGTAGKG